MKSININCPVNSTGYGLTSLNIIKSLCSDIHLSLFPIGSNISVNSEEEKQLVNQLISNADTFNYSSPCLKIWHQYDLSSRIGNGHYYSFPFFEIDKLTTKEQHNLNYCDFIFTASSWSKSILQENNIKKPIYVCPLGVDSNVFKNPIRIKMEQPNYIFFHIGKWEHRKSQDVLLKAFDAAFKPSDNVELRLVPFNPFLSEQENNYWFNLVDSCQLKDKIKIFDRLPTQYNIAEFMYYGDCGVFISRAEGWNLELLEAMAMDKPVIATNYSAHTEYCNDKNCYLVNVDELEPANDGKWFHGEGNWAKLTDSQIEQTAYYMKYVYNNRIDTNSEGVLTANKYSWSNTSNIIQQHMLRNNSYYANTKAKSKRR